MHFQTENGTEDSYFVNLLISVLTRYPEIFTVCYDLIETKCKLSYMIKRPLWGEKYISFKDKLRESFALYCDLLGTGTVIPVINKISFSSMTLLELSWGTQTLSLGEINLVNELIITEFKKTIVSDIREAEVSGQGELIEYLLPYKRENKEKHLFAFRDAGKVYVYDK